jgi:hypothetical protein
VNTIVDDGRHVNNNIAFRLGAEANAHHATGGGEQLEVHTIGDGVDYSANEGSGVDSGGLRVDEGIRGVVSLLEFAWQHPEDIVIVDP